MQDIETADVPKGQDLKTVEVPARRNPETAAPAGRILKAAAEPAGLDSESADAEPDPKMAAVPSEQVLYVGGSLDGKGFRAIRDAIRYAEEHPGHPWVIQIAPGVYREHLVIRTKGLTLRGMCPENTESFFGSNVRNGEPSSGTEGRNEDSPAALQNTTEVWITGSLGAYEILEDGIKRGTFRTQTVLITADDVTLENLTIENKAGPGRLAGQAVALHAYADRLRFYKVRLIGQQDTLFTGPLPEKEVEPGGFRGPTEHFPRGLCRMYFRECYVEGNIDFIFGGACAWFEKCEVFCRNPKYPEQNDSPIAYVTAPSTPAGQPFGYVFSRCLLTSDCPEGSCFLGRPWREDAKVLFLHCRIGTHIRKSLWDDWGKPAAHKRSFFGGYDCVWDGPDEEAETVDFDPAAGQAAFFSHQLTEEETTVCTRENVLQIWDPDFFGVRPVK